MNRLAIKAAAILAASAITASAQDVNITPDVSSHTIDLNGRTVTIARNQDPNNRIDPEFAKTSRACPPFCIHPMEAAAGVETVGELEVIDFIKQDVSDGRGLLIDSRVPEWHAKGTIPGAVNVPFSTLEATNPYRDEILKALGARNSGGSWDFSGAKTLVLFCNGPWCDQSPRSIRNLTAAGYPAEKIKYYRGGMQVWLLLGLNIENPGAS